MALIQRMAYPQSADLLSVDIYDVTGLYNVTTNPTGYGNPTYTPNPLPSDFTDFRGYIYFPDPTTLLPVTTLFDINNIIADYAVIIFPTLPNLTSTPYTYDSAAVFGSSQQWTDGMYRFHTWGITAGGGEVAYETDYIVPIIGQVDCCINNLIIQAKLCGCNKKDYMDLLIARAGLDQLISETRSTGGLSDIEQCQLYNKGAEIILNAQQICNNEDCQPCRDC